MFPTAAPPDNDGDELSPSPFPPTRGAKGGKSKSKSPPPKHKGGKVKVKAKGPHGAVAASARVPSMPGPIASAMQGRGLFG